MRLSKIKNIFKKEVLDTLRDRRTLLIMVIIPVLLYPGLMIFMNELATAQQAKMEHKTIKVALVNVPEDSTLVKRLRAEKGIEIVTVRNPFEDVREGDVHFVLQMPLDAEKRLAERKTALVQLQYDRANDDATTNLDRMRRIIDAFEQDLLEARLKEKNLSAEYIRPINLKEVNVATRRRMGGFLIGHFLPMFMVFMVLIGSMYPAIDMTAGEKERGTLETILTSPATRTEIVIGKFLTVTLIALVTGLLNLGSMMATFTFGIFKDIAAAIQINIPYQCLLAIILCLIPLAIFFSGIMMALASFARSFKEAQSVVMPFYILSTMPAMVSVIPGIRLEGFWLLLPVANVTLLFKELMLGVFNIDHVLLVLFCALFLASVAIFLAIKLFGREEVLFGQASSFGLALKRSNIVAKGTPESSEAVLFTMLSLALLLYVAIPLQLHEIVSGLILTELLIFLSFPLAFAAYLKLDFKQTFRLRVPSSRSVLSTLLMFGATALCLSSIAYLQNQIFPIPKEFEDYIEKVLKTLYGRPFIGSFALIAILPAVCEEMTFRGVILAGMLARFRPRIAILITAVLFGVFHLSFHRFTGVFLIGMAASFLVWRSGSIFTGVMLHLLCNGYVVFLVTYPQFDWSGILKSQPSILYTLAGLVLAGFSVLLMSRPPTKHFFRRA